MQGSAALTIAPRANYIVTVAPENFLGGPVARGVEYYIDRFRWQSS
jgi:hypothetical protein